MQFRDRYYLAGAGLILIAAVLTGFSFRPQPGLGEYLEFELRGDDVRHFPTKTMAAHVNVVFSVEPGRHCVLVGQELRDQLTLRLIDSLRRDSVLAIRCATRKFADGSHAVLSIVIDGDEILSLRDTKRIEQGTRAFQKVLAIFAWVFGIFFTWKGSRQISEARADGDGQHTQSDP